MNELDKLIEKKTEVQEDFSENNSSLLKKVSITYQCIAFLLIAIGIIGFIIEITEGHPNELVMLSTLGVFFGGMATLFCRMYWNCN